MTQVPPLVFKIPTESPQPAPRGGARRAPRAGEGSPACGQALAGGASVPVLAAAP